MMQIPASSGGEQSAAGGRRERVLFLGLLYDDAVEAGLLADSRVGLQAAPNQYQWGLIGGLARLLEGPVEVIASYPTGAYPGASRRVRYGARSVRQSAGVRIDYPGYPNIWILRELVRSLKMYRALKRTLRAHPQSAVVVYSLQIAFSMVIHRVKRRFPDAHVTLIVPDLPGKQGLRARSWTPRAVWNLLGRPLTLRLVRDADSFVLLTEAMRDAVGVAGRPCTVVEGFCPDGLKALEPAARSGRMRITYTGALDRVFGLEMLLEAFSMLSPDVYELWIAGDGPDRSLVEQYARASSNVRYFGFLDSASVTELQRKSTVLVNPRRPEGLYTRYSFPSKLLVYLAAGRPIVAYKLDGVPAEYDAHISYVDGDSAESLARKIAEVCSLGDAELDRRGEEGRLWACSFKSPVGQARKVVALWSQAAAG